MFNFNTLTFPLNNIMFYQEVLKDEQKNFYEDETEKTADDEEQDEELEKRTYIMDSDHRLLLRCTKPLLQSRNSAVCIILSLFSVEFFVC